MLFRRKGMYDLNEMMTQFVMNQLGFGPLGEIHMLAGTSGAAFDYYKNKVIESRFHDYVSYGENALVTLRNDVLLVTPGSHAWRGDLHATGAALTWDKTNTHMLGMAPMDRAGYGRSRFSHSGYTMANFMTVSGDGNVFKNLRWMHGSSTGGASDITCVTVSGAGNTFDSCAFAGPNNATQAASANYLGVSISGSHNYFKNCMFGSVNDVDRSAANTMLNFTTGCGAWNIFENCVFRSRSGGGQATAYFINDKVTDTVVDVTAVFLNCKFIHRGTDLTVAITKAANTSRKLYFDERCSFAGVTDIISAAREAEVILGVAGGYIAALVNSGLAVTYDHTA